MLLSDMPKLDIQCTHNIGLGNPLKILEKTIDLKKNVMSLSRTQVGIFWSAEFLQHNYNYKTICLANSNYLTVIDD